MIQTASLISNISSTIQHFVPAVLVKSYELEGREFESLRTRQMERGPTVTGRPFFFQRREIVVRFPTTFHVSSICLAASASLAACLTTAADVQGAFAHYEKMRLPRTSRVQGMAGTNKTRFHLPDGPAQQERDKIMAGGSTDWGIKQFLGSTNTMPLPRLRPEISGYLLEVRM
jgi:hypothetical protein